MRNYTSRADNESETSSESSKEGKTWEDTLGWKDQNKTTDKSDTATWRDKSKKIIEEKET